MEGEQLETPCPSVVLRLPSSSPHPAKPSESKKCVQRVPVPEAVYSISRHLLSHDPFGPGLDGITLLTESFRASGLLSATDSESIICLNYSPYCMCSEICSKLPQPQLYLGDLS